MTRQAFLSATCSSKYASENAPPFSKGNISNLPPRNSARRMRRASALSRSRHEGTKSFTAYLYLGLTKLSFALRHERFRNERLEPSRKFLHAGGGVQEDAAARDGNRRIALHQGHRRHRFCDHTPRGHHGSMTDDHVGQYDCPRTNERVLFDRHSKRLAEVRDHGDAHAE